jgi:DNA-binding NtrC family response regulator
MTHSKAVLFIDDDPITNRMHELLIKRLRPDIEAVTVNSVDAAIARLTKQKTKPQLIFVDLQLPVKDGWDFINEFIGLGIDAKLYVLTSSIDVFNNSGINDHPAVTEFIEKPLQVHKIKELLKDI